MSGTSAVTAWDSTPTHRRPYPRVLVGLTVVVLVPAVGTTLLRLFPPSDDFGALLASFVPYGLLAYLLALVLLLLALVRAPRRRPLGVLVGAVVALVALHVSWLAPLFVPDHRPVFGPSFTLYTQNAYLGLADPAEVTAAAQGADVVVLSETTPHLLRLLQTDAWQQRYPYAVGDRYGRQSDTTLFSRFPLTDAQLLVGPAAAQWVVSVEVPGREPVRLIGAHPCNPYCGNDAFASDHAVLERAVLDNLDQPLVMAGDLNAIDDHAPLQRLHADGMRSATDLVGGGWVPTWPAKGLLPPLLPIDHVLVDDQLTATAQRTVRLASSDHLGLVVTIAGTS